LTYVRPTQKTKIRNYAFDAFGPYSIVGAGLAAASTRSTTLRRNGNKSGGYAKRFGSDFGIAAVTTTTRYALAQALRKTRCTTAVSAKVCFFRGWAMP